MAHVQSSQLQASQWQGAFTLENPMLPSSARALAPVRGALLGSMLGLCVWGLLAMLAWVIL